MTCDPAATANAAFDDLIDGVVFPVPDLSGIAVPTIPTIDPSIFENISTVTLSELTEEKVDGGGIYETLMRAYANQLATQHSKGRITNDAYAKVYIEGQTQAMQGAIQFALNKDQAYWAAVGAQQSAVLAQAQAAKAVVEFYTAKLQASLVAYQTENAKAEYALTKMRLATAEAEYCTAQYNLEQILPAQKLGIEKQNDLLDANKAQVEAQTTHLTTKEGPKVVQETNNLVSQKAVLDAQKLQIDAQTTHLTSKEGPKVTQETANLVVQGQVLEEQKKLVTEQMEQTRAQTQDTRSDGTTPIVGVIGKQKDLHQQQIDSYKRDAEYKFLKMLSDAWVAQKSMDEGLVAPTIFANASIDANMNSYKAKVSL